MSRRSYPLKIEASLTDDGIVAVFSRGHHAAGAAFMDDRFFAAAKRYLAREHDFGEDELEQLDPEEIRFEAWRCVPDLRDPDHPVLHRKAALSRPGAFPVTVIDVDHI